MEKQSFMLEFFSTGFSLVLYIGIPLVIAYLVHLLLGIPFALVSATIAAVATYMFGYMVSAFIYRFLNINIEKIAQDRIGKLGGGGSSSSGLGRSTRKKAQKEEDDEIDINNLPPVEEEEEEEYSAETQKDENKSE